MSQLEIIVLIIGIMIFSQLLGIARLLNSILNAILNLSNDLSGKNEEYEKDEDT